MTTSPQKNRILQGDFARACMVAAEHRKELTNKSLGEIASFLAGKLKIAVTVFNAKAICKVAEIDPNLKRGEARVGKEVFTRIESLESMVLELQESLAKALAAITDLQIARHRHNGTGMN